MQNARRQNETAFGHFSLSSAAAGNFGDSQHGGKGCRCGACDGKIERAAGGIDHKMYRNHSNINDGVRRFVTFIVTDTEVKASRFHAVSCFNNSGEKCESCQIHDIFAAKQSGNEDSMLENWIRALISKSDAEESTDNVSSITEASGYKVA